MRGDGGGGGNRARQQLDFAAQLGRELIAAIHRLFEQSRDIDVEISDMSASRFVDAAVSIGAFGQPLRLLDDRHGLF